MDIKMTAVHKAVAMLNAAGAQFKIIAADGSQFGTLETKPPVTRKRSGIDFRAIYHPLISGMQVGDAKKFDAPAGISAEALRGAMCGWASQKWGNGSYISAMTGNTIEILRVS